jgi:hypothetical protein
MHKFHNSGESSTATVHMEINGHPYYMKSKGNVPYLYDIDTHDEVGYWSSKKGQYVMFSLYNKLMNSLKEKQHTESKGCDDDSDGQSISQTTEMDSSSKSQEDDADDDSSSKSQEDDADELDSDSDSDSDSNVIVTRETQKNQINTYLLIFVFLMLFVYLTLQKEFQSIYLDFVFLILINLLNTLKVFEFMNEE